MISIQINIDGNNNKIELVKAIQNGTQDLTDSFKNIIDKKNNADLDSIVKRANNLEKYPNDRKYQPKNKKELKALIKGLIIAHGYNVNLNIIDTSLITDMSDLFYVIENGRDTIYRDVVWGIYENFNGDISQWDVSNVKNMSHMFEGGKFNGDISNWDVSNVEDMSFMFCENKAFNGDLSKWNMSKVKTIQAMFHKSAFCNDSVNNWDTSNIENFGAAFSYTNFNGRLDNWNTSKAVDMGSLFNHGAFNNDSIKNWDMRNVKDVSHMLSWTPFDKDLSNWRLNSVENCTGMFERAWDGSVPEYNAAYMNHWMDNRIDYISALSKKRREEKEKFINIGVGTHHSRSNVPTWFQYLIPKKKRVKTTESTINKYRERLKFKEDLKNILD